MARIVVTGGAGFIGSHLTEKLLELGNEVTVVDNLSSGKKEFIEHLFENKNFNFVKDDLLNKEGLYKTLEGHELIFHLAANPDVRIGAENTYMHLEQNIIATYNVLEAMRKSDVQRIAFTSTSTVYGEAKTIPTPENYAPLIPISLYASSKLACEAMISAYCYTFGFNAVSYRFANVVGPKSTHGVTYDFIRKLRANPSELTILGDGSQTKSYCYITDCIDAMLFGLEHSKERHEFFNIGSDDYIDVKSIARIVIEEMGLKDVRFKFTGGVDGGRGWKGDVKVMLLSIEKLKNLGWMPKYSSSESIRMTARALLSDCIT